MNSHAMNPEILFEQQQRYGDLTCDLPDMIFSMDAELKFSSFNHACEIFTGRNDWDLIGKTMDEAFPDVAPLFAVECLEVLETKLPKVFPATTVSHGRSLLFNVHIYPTYDGVVVFFNDQTREISLELDGIEIIERLPKPSADLRQFVDTLSDDRRGPMSKLKSLMLLSAVSPDSTTDNHLLQRIAAVVARMARKKDKDGNRDSSTFAQKEYVTFEAELKKVKKSLLNEISESKAFVTCDFQIAGLITVKERLYTIIYRLVATGIKPRAKDIVPMVHLQTYETSESLFFSVTVKGLASGGSTAVPVNDLYSDGKRIDDTAELKDLRNQAEILGAAVDIQQNANGNTITLFFPKSKI